jgi:hypothetical protein
MVMTAFWDIAPPGLVEVDDVSEVCTASIAVIMKAVLTSETSFYFIETTQCCVQKAVSSYSQP